MSVAQTAALKAKARSKAAPASKTAARAPAVAATSNKGKSKTRPRAGAAFNAPERDRLVAQTAYFRAEKRGFAPGFELEDWVEAEAEVQRLIGSP